MEDKFIVCKKTPIGSLIVMDKKERWTLVRHHIHWWTRDEAERILSKFRREKAFTMTEVPPQYSY
jgi:hypothetical protein